MENTLHRVSLHHVCCQELWSDFHTDKEPYLSWVTNSVVFVTITDPHKVDHKLLIVRLAFHKCQHLGWVVHRLLKEDHAS